MTSHSPRSKDSDSQFRVQFWGVRGSYPTANSSNRHFGGNTSCVEVRAGGRRLIFDAGTGIIPLGKELCDGASPPPSAYIFLSHTHIDHVMGLCFFEPLLTPRARTFILGPGDRPGDLTRSLRHLFRSTSLKARRKFSLSPAAKSSVSARPVDGRKSCPQVPRVASTAKS
jgi:phosphoribosyl 1,2-cyclic phosphodiesterase